MSRWVLITLTFVGLTLGLVSEAYSDSAGAPTEEIHKSSNGQYYLRFVPKGELLDDDYYIEWTYGRTEGPVYFKRKGEYRTDVKIADSGDYFVVAGNYTHNSISLVREGLWFYNKQGGLIRHVETPRCYPFSHSISSIWWFWKSQIQSNLDLYILQTVDGARRVYSLKTGGLIFFLPAIWHLTLIGTAATFTFFFLRRFRRFLKSGPHIIIPVSLQSALSEIREKMFNSLMAGVSSLKCSIVAVGSLYIIAFAYIYFTGVAYGLDVFSPDFNLDIQEKLFYAGKQLDSFNKLSLMDLAGISYTAVNQAVVLFVMGLVFFTMRQGAVRIRTVYVAGSLFLLNFICLFDTDVYWPLLAAPVTASLALMIPVRSRNKHA